MKFGLKISKKKQKSWKLCVEETDGLITPRKVPTTSFRDFVASKIQAAWRRTRSRRAYVTLRNAAVVIQARVRHVARRGKVRSVSSEMEKPRESASAFPNKAQRTVTTTRSHWRVTGEPLGERRSATIQGDTPVSETTPPPTRNRDATHMSSFRS